ncbi:MAG: NosD domain-containing protein [Candidatus Bathyarchaeia archaeon]|jgi:parallel beta-helix repeat protein
MKQRKLALAAILTFAVSMLVLLQVVGFVNLAAQTNSAVTIRPDGSIEGTSQIQRQEDTYTLMGNLSCSIYVQRSGIVIDGAGYAINGGGEGTGIDLNNYHGVDSSRAQITNVTVKNLKITNFGHAVEFIPSVNNTFIGNYVKDCYCGFYIWHSANNTLIHNTIENCVSGISISFGGNGNIITENNILNSSVFVMRQCPDNKVDRNYWSNYTTRYPNAEEIEDTGIWDTPYEGHEAFTDNHPLVEIINIETPLPPTNTGNQTLEIQSTLFLVIAVSVLAVVLYFRRKTQKG